MTHAQAYSPYARYVRSLEAQGMTTSDAQAIADTKKGQRAIDTMQAIDEAMTCEGFEIQDTGGGCLAYVWRGEAHDGISFGEALVTDENDAGLPTHMGKAVVLGFYDGDGNCIQLRFNSVNSLLSSMRKVKP